MIRIRIIRKIIHFSIFFFIQPKWNQMWNSPFWYTYTVVAMELGQEMMIDQDRIFSLSSV